MKKIIVMLAALVCPILLYAADNDALLAKIESACSKLASAQASFTHVRTTAAKTSVTQEGTMYFQAPGKLSMVYDADLFVINGDNVYIRRGGKVNRFDTSKVPSMKGLSATLTLGMAGKIKEIAETNNALYNIEDGAKEYKVTIAARAKAPRGYSRIVMTFRKSDCMVTSLETTEFNGMVNSYTLAGFSKNVPVDDSVFAIPEK